MQDESQIKPIQYALKLPQNVVNQGIINSLVGHMSIQINYRYIQINYRYIRINYRYIRINYRYITETSPSGNRHTNLVQGGYSTHLI